MNEGKEAFNDVGRVRSDRRDSQHDVVPLDKLKDRDKDKDKDRDKDRETDRVSVSPR